MLSRVILNNKTLRGFSLIEMAAVVVISGIILATITGVYSKYLEEKHTRLTYERMQKVYDAMQRFYDRQGRYPCPASPVLMDGMENCSSPFMTANGRNTPYDNDQVFIGSVPYLTLQRGLESSNPNMALSYDLDSDNDEYIGSDEQISKIDTIDGWYRQITYIVSAPLTDPALFKAEYASIGLVNEAGQSLVKPDGSAAWVLISHGADGAGAYNNEGSKSIPDDCVGLEDGADNCDLQTGSGETLVILSALVNNIRGTNFFDDVVFFAQPNKDSFWGAARNDISGSRSSSMKDITNRNIGFVGIGTRNPVQMLDISGGSMYADRLIVSGICNQDGSNCLLDPANYKNNTPGGLNAVTGINPLNGALTFGTVTGPATLAIKITDAAASCYADVTGACSAATPFNTCVAGFYVIGITTTGQIICGNP